MASSSTFSLLFLLLLSFVSGRMFAMANGQRTWCIAKPSSNEATLLANINYACSQVDCRVLHKGCPCFSPDNLINHASIAMNLYFRAHGCQQGSCDFRGSALIVITDPSYDNCLYE
ncbi:glucan endo-1,3-beta-glucosidase isoform X2 [Spinacia oleracea]|uniref:Glucan endo-1,3-beta-glucosidase isoform X2 n=1 Tax=Spinacia oleracea TaxID=3562 RepID=A0A9R0I738_SPIOL|nr:glucan endo-1,3-beta-glucosidase isoform X2 [Spinacia oleracea]